MTRVNRHRLDTSVDFGNYSSNPVEIDDGESHHISGSVEIEVSGATPKDRPHTYELLEALEQAVIDTLEDFDGGNGGDGQ